VGSKQGAVRPAGLARANELELKIPRLPPVSERWWAPWRPKIVHRAGRERREKEQREQLLRFSPSLLNTALIGDMAFALVLHFPL